MTTTEAFAAERHERLVSADDEMRALVREALTSYVAGEADWTEPIMTGTQVLWLEIFELEAPDAYADAALKDFREELAAALEKTTLYETVEDAQVDRITRWLGTYTVNSATFNATGANGARTKTWVTMHDSDVRAMHVRADGQTVSVRNPFDIDGHKLAYPGQPVGDPEAWINCRCLVRATGKTKTLRASAAVANEAETFEERTSVVIVALPTESDPIVAASSEDITHLTMVWLGDKSQLEATGISLDDLKANLASWAEQVDGPLIEKVSGSATLGADQASVALIDASSIAQLRLGMIEEEPEEVGVENPPLGAIATVYSQTEQFPVWIPHVTLGYPETPALAEYAGTEVTFDRLALWVGDERTEYTLSKPITAAAAETSATEEAPAEAGKKFHGVAAPLGVPTGDGRMFAVGGMTWRDLPLPLAYQHESSHGGMPGTTVVVGVIERMWIDGENLVQYEGTFSESAPEVATVVAGINDRTIRGVSVDVDSVEIEVSEVDYESMSEQEFLDMMSNPPVTVFRKARTSGLTIVPIGAFQEAYIANGPAPAEVDAEQLALVASADTLDRTGVPLFSLVASALPEVLPADWFANPGLTEPTPFTVDDDGRVFGHLATWDSCHLGMANVCKTPPYSSSNYAYFRTGAVSTDAGDVAVGHLTMETGHAALSLGSAPAAAHYDNTGTVFADVAAGEDSIGIWVAGALREGLSSKELRAAKGAALSGDWRPYRGGLELVAALAVNTPGFPIPRTALTASAAGGQTALVASGIVTKEDTMATGPSIKVKLDVSDAAGLVASVADEMEHRQERKARLASLAAKRAPLVALAMQQRADRVSAAKRLVVK